MRGGTYGWQAADAGVIGICWTNTLPNLPAWGADTPRIGNNPLVMAVPRPEGHLVLDMAMSQFSYGALAAYRSRGESLPVPGGFDSAGAITSDPGAIEASRRPLPIGFWKGAGLSIMLDAIAASLAGGRASHQIPTTHRTGNRRVAGVHRDRCVGGRKPRRDGATRRRDRCRSAGEISGSARAHRATPAPAGRHSSR
jgi:LDH2 family malate/lactate/ureidoglycolate dehydrogenase